MVRFYVFHQDGCRKKFRNVFDVGLSSILCLKWSLLFYPTMKRTHVNPIWVKILCLPLEWNTKEGLKAISNQLGGIFGVDD